MSRRKSKGLGDAGGALLRSARQSSEADLDGTPRRQSSLVSTLQRQGSDEGVVRDLPLGEIADHPDNPPQRLEDIEDLADSIREVGVLQPIVVVPVDVFRAHWAGPAEAVSDGFQWVAYMGHRRKAASRLAEMSTIPAIVRPDLDKPADAPTAFIVENLHRKDLSPLEEARAYGALADLGHGQSEIAARCGVSQGHVSKRVRLLGLPPRIQEALPPAGAVTLEEADKLTKLTDSDQQLQIFDRSQRTGAPIASLISEVESQRKDRQRVEAARSQADAEGVEVVDARERFGPGAAARRLGDSTSIEEARSNGTLVAEPTPYGLRYYTTVEPVTATTRETVAEVAPDLPAANASDSAPRGDTEEPSAPGAADDQESQVRLDACCDYVRRSRPKRKTAVVGEVVDTLLNRVDRVDVHAARSLAHTWLGNKIGAESVDADRWLASLDDVDAVWAAHATCVAIDELLTQVDPATDVARRHIRRLIDSVNYTPTTKEADHISAEYSGGIPEGKHA